MVNLLFPFVTLALLYHGMWFTDATVQKATKQYETMCNMVEALTATIGSSPKDARDCIAKLRNCELPDCSDYRHYMMESDQRNTNFIGSRMAIPKQLKKLFADFEGFDVPRLAKRSMIYLGCRIKMVDCYDIKSSHPGCVTVEKVYVQQGEILYSGDISFKFCTGRASFTKGTMFVRKVNIYPYKNVLESSTVMQVIEMEPWSDCTHYKPNWMPIPEYSWPIETTWGYLNQIFLANRCSFSSPFKDCAPYIALNKAYETIGKISMYVSFFEEPKCLTLNVSVYDLGQLCTMNQVPASLLADMKLFKDTDADFYKSVANENCIIIYAADGKEVPKAASQLLGSLTIVCIFVKGFKPTKELLKVEGMFMFYNSIHMLFLKLYPVMRSKASRHCRLLLEKFVHENTETLKKEKVLVVLDGTWVTGGLTVLSVDENHATKKASYSGLISVGNRKYTIHSMLKDVEKPHPAKTLGEYFGLWQASRPIL